MPEPSTLTARQTAGFAVIESPIKGYSNICEICKKAQFLVIEINRHWICEDCSG